MEKLQELDMPKSRGGKQKDERRSSNKGITKNSSKYKLPMYQLELEAGQGKKVVFMLISMKLWINLPGKAAGTGNSQCFKTGFNHIMQGFINQRIAEDRKPSLCYRFLSC